MSPAERQAATIAVDGYLHAVATKNTETMVFTAGLCAGLLARLLGRHDEFEAAMAAAMQDVEAGAVEKAVELMKRAGLGAVKAGVH